MEKHSSSIQELAEQAELRLVPNKSKEAYFKEYEKLMKWMESKNSKTVNESVMLAYMMEMVIFRKYNYLLDFLTKCFIFHHSLVCINLPLSGACIQNFKQC